MNYLNLCQLAENNKSANGFTGFINPRNYSDWKNLKPLVLFFEGIHQYAVKVARIHTDDKVRLVPVKLQDIKICQEATYDEFKIIGSLIKHITILKISFEAVGKNNDLLATGVVTVAPLGYGR